MIEVKNLTKFYGDHKAVSNLNFKIETGEVVGFLGPNGAGKTTTMNMMTGCLAANEGSITIDGLDIFEDAIEAKKKIGYLPELPPLYTDMTPEEYLRFVARAKGLKGPDIERDVTHVMRVAGIHNVKSRLIKHLSKGYRQRVGIAQAILGDPEIIILDEPTVGLDPKQIIEIRELIKTLGQNRTVILSSHILSEVSEVCGRILIISKGHLVADDQPEALAARLEGNVSMEVRIKADQYAVLAVLDNLDDVAKSDILSEKDGITVVKITAAPNVAEDALGEALFTCFAALGKPILSMVPQHSSLEDIFLELTASSEDTERRREEHRAEAGSAAPKRMRLRNRLEDKNPDEEEDDLIFDLPVEEEAAEDSPAEDTPRTEEKKEED